MIRALRTASAGMYVQQLYVDTIANNLANVNTTGFKKSKAEFQDLFYQTLESAGSSAAEGTEIQVGHGARLAAIHTVFSQGDVSPTQNALDVVINGRGFFQIVRPDGTIVYTRDGALKLSSDGRIVTSDGYALEPDISLPTDTTDIQIGADGTVSVLITGEREPEPVGDIELAKFVNPSGLRSLGRNLYESTVASGEPLLGTPGTEGFGELMQGYLEMSNVKVAEEMVNMIVAQRAYEINVKVIKTVEEMLSLANNIRR